MWCLLFMLAPSVRALTLGIDSALHYSNGTFFHAVNSDGSFKWTFEANFPIVTYKEGLNNTIHIGTRSLGSDPNITYYGLDGMDGSILWQRASLVVDHACHCESPVVDHVCRSRSDVWFLSIDSSDSPLYLVRTCFADEPHLAPGPAPIPDVAIEAIDDAGAVKWSQLISNAVEVDVGPDGGLLMRSRRRLPHSVGDTLTALLPESGATKWILNFENAFRGWALSNGDVYVVPMREVNDHKTFAQDLLRVSGGDGSIVWNVSSGSVTLGKAPARPTRGCNGEVYVYALGLNSYDFLAFDDNGNILRTWTHPTYDPSNGDSVAHLTRQIEDGSEEDMFVTHCNLKCQSKGTVVTVYSGTAGHFLWNASLPGRYFLNYHFNQNGTVFATANDQKYVAIRDGHVAWRENFAWRGPHLMAVLIAKDGNTYFQYDGKLPPYDGHDNHVVALNMDGTQRWTYPTMNPPIGSELDAQSFSIFV